MKYPLLCLLLGSLLATGSCIPTPDPDARAAVAPHAKDAAPAATMPLPPLAGAPATATVGAVQHVLVHKNPTCGCCEVWVEHLRDAGFRVEVRDEENLEPIRQRLGVPYGKGSCHTAEVAGYVIEGHIPASDIRSLLAEKPEARGLALPGMPLGSPGMEVEGAPSQPYTVELVRADGTTENYATHTPEAGGQ